MDNMQQGTPTYYEQSGDMADAVLRCAGCRRLVTHAELAAKGTCSCGIRRMSEVRSLSPLEWFKIYTGIINFPRRLDFLKEFRR